jgi:peptide/nickel transport system permease protein
MQSNVEAPVAVTAGDETGQAEEKITAYRPWAAVASNFAGNKLAVAGLVVALLLIGIAIAAPAIAPHDPIQQFDAGLSDDGSPLPPGGIFLLGTDGVGRDVESRLIYGARISLLIGTVANGLAIVIGVVMGGLAGYFGGAVETAAMRLTDIMMSFPLILLLIALAVILQPSVGVIIVVIAIGGWTGTARLIHGEILSLKERDFVLAARAVGVSNTRILARHMLPHVIPSMIVWAMLGIAPAIMTETVLSFLGVGVQPPSPSWGNMISDGQAYYRIAPWLVLYPGLALVLTVVAFNLAGDGLRDALYAGTGRRG